jgi:large subunit ribosomal protein L17e
MIYLILNYYYIELWAKPPTPETPTPPKVTLTLSLVAKTSGRDLRIHYKNTYETAKAIKGLTIAKAKQYLKDVLAHRRCVPFTKHYGGIGRTGQAAEFGKTLGRWPEKSVRSVLGLVNNLESNANAKNMKNLVIDHVQVDRAAKGRRRTYRAHGRIGPYLSSQTHIQIYATEKAVDVKREGKARQVAKGKIPVGEK